VFELSRNVGWTRCALTVLLSKHQDLTCSLTQDTNSAQALRYAATAPISEGSMQFFAADRQRSCSLMFMTEIAYVDLSLTLSLL
jgi:hypothetical protein